MPRIYVQNKPLFLIDKVEGEVEEFLHRPDTVFIDELTTASLRTILDEMEKENIYAGIFLHSDVNKLLDAFKTHLTLIKAGGGLVYNEDGKLLLIFRKGKWDLPKGKLEEEEELELCALREVEEETGVLDAKIVQPLHVTYHTYYEREKQILKESHWFLMNVQKLSVLKPQIEEDIEKCEWAPFSNIQVYKNNMHASIIDVVEKLEIMLADR